MATKKKAEKRANEIREKHVADVTHKPPVADDAANNAPLETLDDTHGRAAAVATHAHDAKTPQSTASKTGKKATANPYEAKIEEIRQDLSTLVTKLRAHGIHVSLDPRAEED